MEQETRLYRNAKKTRNLLLYAGAVNILLVLVLLYSIGIHDGILKIKPAIFSGAALLLMLFFTFKTVSGTRDKSPLIEIDATGFSGKTTPLSKAFGRIEWSDLRELRLEKTAGDTLVVATVGNTQKYQGRLSKMMWKMAHDERNDELRLMYAASEIEIDAAELLELLDGYWKNPAGI